LTKFLLILSIDNTIIKDGVYDLSQSRACGDSSNQMENTIDLAPWILAYEMAT